MTRLQARQSPVVRHRMGDALSVPADLDLRLRDIAQALRVRRPLGDLIQYSLDPGGRFVAPESSWVQLLAELLWAYERGSAGNDEHLSPLVSVLDVLGTDAEPLTSWRNVRQLMIDNIDLLSGWQRSGQSRNPLLLPRPQNVEHVYPAA